MVGKINLQSFFLLGPDMKGIGYHPGWIGIAVFTLGNHQDDSGQGNGHPGYIFQRQPLIHDDPSYQTGDRWYKRHDQRRDAGSYTNIGLEEKQIAQRKANQTRNDQPFPLMEVRIQREEHGTGDPGIDSQEKNGHEKPYKIDTQ